MVITDAPADVDMPVEQTGSALYFSNVHSTDDGLVVQTFANPEVAELFDDELPIKEEHLAHDQYNVDKFIGHRFQKRNPMNVHQPAFFG